MRFSSWLGSQSHRANIRCIAEGRKSCKISRCCECPTKRAVLRNIHCFNLNLKDTLALSLHNILSTHLNESYTFQSIRRHERVILCTSLPLTSAATRHSPHIYTRHSTAFHDVSSSCKLHQETVAKKEQEHGRREVAKQHLRSAFCDHNPFQ